MSDETLFHEALAKPPAERATFLDSACAGDAELRQRVEALLQAHDQAGSFLKQAPPATSDYVPSNVADARLPGTSDYQPTAGPGAVIAGRYSLVEKIGEGGMGEVWIAKQTEPVKRKVAIKLIKAGMDTKAVLQRFEQERQALALMDHPHIAKVLDGGITADRRPFFVMELVSGLPLTRFCDDAKLGVRERLELFVPICQAVQHAHQKGIIHRDLKPSNILVTIIDGRGVPKVIDFGVAKATSGRLIEESLSTQFGAVVGTLEYMSPEQAGFAGEDIDTRADIYSLGVILYELLTGLRPLDAQRLRKAALTEMVRIIREEEPSKPSTRISTDDSAPSLAALRHTEPKKLAALLRGELDWVVMKCLEKQRDRRYETANGLARDIQRYLADEVVEARPPSAGYRLQKFVTRNRSQVIATTLVLFALLAGLLGTAYGFIRAERAKLGEAEQRSKAEKEREITQQAIVGTRNVAALRLQQATEAIAGGNFLRAKDLLQWFDPLLQNHAELADVRSDLETLQAQVNLYAEFRQRLDDARFAARYGSRQEKEKGRGYCQKLIEWYEAIEQRAGRGSVGLPPLNGEQRQIFKEDVFESLLTAAQVEQELAQGDDVAERQAATKALAWLNQAEQVLPSTRALRVHRAPCWEKLGKGAAAAADLEAARAIEPASAVDHFWNGFAFHLRGDHGLEKKDTATARDCYRKGIAEYAAFLKLRPEHFWGYFNWANCHAQLNEWLDLQDAMIGYTACIRLRPDFPWSYNNRGTVHLRLRQPELALADFDAALARSDRYPEAHTNRGLAYLALGKTDLALQDFNQAIAINPDSLAAYSERVELYRKRNQHEEAIRDYEQLARLDAKNPARLMALADCLRDAQKDGHQVAAAYREALKIDAKNIDAWIQLGTILTDNLADHDGAASAFRRAIELDPKNGVAYRNLCVALSQKQDWPAAVAAGRKAVELMPHDGKARYDLALALGALGQTAEARAIVVDLMAKAPPAAVNPRTYLRYNAACWAARMGDRQSAYDWLAADLDAWSKLFNDNPTRTAAELRQWLAHWLADNDLAGVRDPIPLADLPLDERAKWAMLWTKVRKLMADATARESATERPKPEKQP